MQGKWHTITTMSLITKFFGAQRQYAVVGASNSQHKYGYIITKWYVDRGLNVVPVNPSAVLVLDRPTEKSITSVLHELPDTTNDGLSISFVTPPSVSILVIEEMSRISNVKTLVRGLWFQPGSYDSDVILAVQECGLSELMVPLGECILIKGDTGLADSKL